MNYQPINIPAAQGGTSRLVSSVTIHNEMLRHHPALLEQLYQPYPMLRHRVNTTATQPVYLRPIFAMEQGHFACNILRPYIDFAHNDPTCPSMTPLQIEALDTFEAIAASSAIHHEFSLEPGDIVIFNNYTMLHARTAFADDADPDKRRLLLRLWLSVNNSRPLPQSYLPVYHTVGAGEIRGGFLAER